MKQMTSCSLTHFPKIGILMEEVAFTPDSRTYLSGVVFKMSWIRKVNQSAYIHLDINTLAGDSVTEMFQYIY